MKIIDSSKRAHIGLLILGALLLLGYNAYQLLSLKYRPALGSSDQVKLASRQWNELEQISALSLTENSNDISVDQLSPKFASDILKKEPIILQPKGIAKAVKKRPNPNERAEIDLPVLTGILQVSDAQGNVRSFAMIDGESWVERSTVQGFTIDKITEKGVTLTRKGESWFLSAPELFFSVNQEP